MTNNVTVLPRRWPAHYYRNGSLIKRPSRYHPDPDHWKALREHVFAKQKGICNTCPALANDLHHKHYDTWGREQPDDVIALCRVCHKGITLAQEMHQRCLEEVIDKDELAIALHEEELERGHASDLADWIRDARRVVSRVG